MIYTLTLITLLLFTITSCDYFTDAPLKVKFKPDASPEKILKLISSAIDHGPKKVKLSSRLHKDLALTKDQSYLLVSSIIKHEFNIQISDAEIDKITTVSDIINHINKHLPK